MKKIANITIDEKDKMEDLFEKKNSFEDLIETLKSSNTNIEDVFYKKVTDEYNDAKKNYQDYWTYLGNKYKLQKYGQNELEMSFRKCEIYYLD